MPHIIARTAEIVIRQMQETEHDLCLYLKWMTDPHTMKYWEGMNEHFTYEKVVQEYREHCAENVEQCIIEYNQLPIGYCQFYTVNADAYEVPEPQYRKFADTGDTVYGIDIFIGEVSYRNHGIGTQCLKVLMKALFENWNADGLMIDPIVTNARAIKCYHKCGFHDLFVVPCRQLRDGVYHDNLIMGIRKAEFTSCVLNTLG